MKLIACETMAAITLHLRETNLDDIRYSGHSDDVQTLCGMRAAWDTKLPIEFARCSVCRTRAGMPWV